MVLNIQAICEKIGIPSFCRNDLLEIALTHPSYIYEDQNLTQQEKKRQTLEYKRLALLGDAILTAIVTDYLYEKFPTLDVNILSLFKSDILLNKQRISDFAEILNLRELSQRGKNATEIDKIEQNRFKSETFEALLAAIYLNFKRDFQLTGAWMINRFIAPTIDQNIHLIEQSTISSQQEYRKQIVLGSDLLGAIIIDYLYHRFRDQTQGKLTQWKSKLVEKKAIFTQEIKANLAQIYLNCGRNFTHISDWVIERFLITGIDKLLTEDTLAEGNMNWHSISMNNFDKLMIHIEEKHKQDEFLELANTLKPADDLLLSMKQKIDLIANQDRKLQELLSWINHKSSQVNLTYQPAAIRSFYLSIIRVLGLSLVKVFDPNIHINSAKIRNLIRHFEKANLLSNAADVTIRINLSQGLDPAGIIACIFIFDIEPELKLVLKELQMQILPMKNNIKSFHPWRQDNGQVWLNKLTTAIGHDLQFSTKEKEILKKYYYIHNLLVECLNSDNCEVTNIVRKEIEDNLLLPAL